MVVLVWDLDGTLVDSTYAVPRAMGATVGRLGGFPPSRGEVIGAYGVGGPAAMLGHFLGRRLTAEEVDVYHQLLLDERVDAYAGVAAVLGELRGRGLPVAVVTGATVTAAQTLLAAAGLAADVVVGSDRVQQHKPAPDGLLLCAAELGVRGSDLAYVGDAWQDVEAAHRAGALAVGASWGHLYDVGHGADRVLLRPEEALDLL